MAAGHRVRVTVLFGKDWYESSLRRLKENPKIAGYVTRDVLGSLAQFAGPRSAFEASGLVASIAGWISWLIGGSPCSCSARYTLSWAPRSRGLVYWYATRSTRTAPGLPRRLLVGRTGLDQPIVDEDEVEEEEPAEAVTAR